MGSDRPVSSPPFNMTLFSCCFFPPCKATARRQLPAAPSSNKAFVKRLLPSTSLRVYFLDVPAIIGSVEEELKGKHYHTEPDGIGTVCLFSSFLFSPRRVKRLATYTTIKPIFAYISSN